MTVTAPAAHRKVSVFIPYDYDLRTLLPGRTAVDPVRPSLSET
jgi:hypothetical protein